MITSEGPKNIVQVSVDGAGGRESIEATETHPFWVPVEGRWAEAGELQPAQRLRTSAGTYVKIASVAKWSANGRRVHNFTVADFHTYYVATGSSDILVHNHALLHGSLTAGAGCACQGDEAVRRTNPQRHADLDVQQPSRAEAHAYAEFAWKNGTPVPGRPNVRDCEFGRPVGRGPNGGWQTKVRVHINGQDGCTLTRRGRNISIDGGKEDPGRSDRPSRSLS
ncbi:polymorphic toxin-type HINT domain-containing protein [Nonomuraea sp. NPDC049480]|uniref:polymorphic toxin-type HINT domain-containing protein n=1 Tax=Nonomuraea sp. NPDC049480 TaxID=3364353 RepID=UPI0037A9E2E1